jgi:hypothetical protein
MHHARLYPTLIMLALAACQTGPHNGTTVTGSVIGKAFQFQGFYHQPSSVITLQVLNDPANDPSVATNWATFATAISSTTPTTINSPDPLYDWSVTAVPVPNVFVAARWPQGGLVRVRALHSDASGEVVLTTFDDITFSDCLNTQLNAGASWQTIGSTCAGLGGNTAALVSTSNVPVPAGTAATYGGYLGKKGTITSTDTTKYYLATKAPATLADFRTTFGFPAGAVTATYYNDSDLGLGRETHCKLIGGGGVACYVTNYSGVSGMPAFNQDPNVILADAVGRVHSFGTLAITYNGTTGPNSVKFMAYDAAGYLATTVQLDSTGNNISIPNSCLACHGIDATYTPELLTVSGNAKLLPFDPFSYKYSTAPGYTFADQADKLRQLNAIILSANPTPATAALINGMYAPKLVTDPTAVAKSTYIPSTWQAYNGNLDGIALYNGFIKVGCRTCHVSSAKPALDFDSPDDVTAAIGVIRTGICGPTHVMPQAERPMKKIWEGGARAYLVTGFAAPSYPSSLQACKP